MGKDDKRYRDSKSCIYVITNSVNGKFYVGSTVSSKRRWYSHKRSLKNNQHDNGHLQNAWNKYGENAFTFVVLLEENSQNILLKWEDWFLQMFCGSSLCYNINFSATAPSAGRIVTEETKRKLSESLRGRKVSDEARRNMSEVMCNVWSRDNLPESWKTLEHLRNLSERSETIRRRKISESAKGRLFSNERKQNISKSKIGFIVTEETKRKISKSISNADCRKGKFSKEYISRALDMYLQGNFTQKHVANTFGISESYFGKLLKREYNSNGLFK